ncbi:11-beta-hydroxysteroid dehydrogenase A [Arachis duranensis]|nr:11-beta-hydroxysteroid dehydrogenase A [Arachis duranensis]
MLGMQNASVTLAPWDIYHIYESTSLVFPPISLTVFLQAATIMVVDEWILNILVPPTCIALLLFILPPYLLFKIIYYVLRSLLKENVAGKVILITGASSGIGEHIAYEYGRRGARLALVARRENRLKEVAQRAMALGSPHVITIPADVSILKDCQRFVDCTVNRFGRLDHLVNNAGVVPVCLFEHATDISNFAPAMDINLWGSAYATYFSIPHLRKSRGKIIAIASSAGWLPTPRMIFYNASKAAVISLYESLRTELGKDIGITIVTPGLVESEMTQGKFLSKDGQMVLDQEMRDVLVSLMPIRSVTEAAKSIVNSACRGDPYLTEPAWIRTTLYLQIFCPQLLEYLSRWTLISGTSERDTISKKLLHLSCLKKYLYPESVRNPTLQPN